MSDKQLEFDFEQYAEPRRVSAPVTEYFRKAFTPPTAEEIATATDVAGRAIKAQTVAASAKTVMSTREFGETVGLKNERGPWTRAQTGHPTNAPILSTDSAERKNTPMYSGCLMYFPLALAAVARHTKRGNDKHNPGQPLHWAREKSSDHMDCLVRHAVDVEHYNAELGEYEEACALATRALMKLQLLEEKRLGRSK